MSVEWNHASLVPTVNTVPSAKKTCRCTCGPSISRYPYLRNVTNKINYLNIFVNCILLLLVSSFVLKTLRYLLVTKSCITVKLNLPSSLSIKRNVCISISLPLLYYKPTSHIRKIDPDFLEWFMVYSFQKGVFPKILSLK